LVRMTALCDTLLLVFSSMLQPLSKDERRPWQTDVATLARRSSRTGSANASSRGTGELHPPLLQVQPGAELCNRRAGKEHRGHAGERVGSLLAEAGELRRPPLLAKAVRNKPRHGVRGRGMRLL
jgi:hypothetical protein